MSSQAKLSILLAAAISASIPCAAAVAADRSPKPIVIAAGLPAEKGYLVENQSALLETSPDPACPFTRVADGTTMSYVYKFAPGRGSASYLLLTIGSQFLISASSDAGKTYKPVSEMKRCELLGTRVLVDLTPFLAKSDTVLVKFEDRYKQDGWGSLLSEIRYYQAGKAPYTRLTLDGGWKSGGAAYTSGKSVRSTGAVRFSTTFTAPAGWKGQDIAVYFPSFQGSPVSARLNGSRLDLKRTWDQGYWADIAASMAAGKPNRLEVVVKAQDGKAGLWAPVRVGLRHTACAVPVERRFDGQALVTNHRYEPYVPEKMNYLAANYMQCLLDGRYNLLAFSPGEHMPYHFLHDSFRSLVALAEEDRYTPVVRLELARRLYKGLKGGLLPGGEYLYAFKHDERPIDIRPYPDSKDLTVVQKMDNWSYVCSVGLSASNASGEWSGATSASDSAVRRDGQRYSFTRSMDMDGRAIKVNAVYGHGGSGLAPTFEFALDGKGPVRIDLGRMAESGMWFIPGSWGPEAAVLPDGKEIWAHEQDLDFRNPDFRYIFIRGGNGIGDTVRPDYSYNKAIMAMWDKTPSRVFSTKRAQERLGRHGVHWTDLTLEYDNRAPSTVKITVMPFAGYPDSLKTPRALAENLLKTGNLGTGWYDPVWTTDCNGIGPDGMAAAAYLFKKYKTPEAAEAEDLAVKAMQATIDRDLAGTRTQELYYLLRGCTYLHLMGHTEFDPWMRTWADRVVAGQKPDGSWEWLNYQLRCMESLLHAYETLGDEKYLDSVKKGLATLSYKDGDLYWHDQVQYYDDFGGALTSAVFGYLGMTDMFQKALDSRTNYVGDWGYVACSDLNPYMIGLAAKGLGLKTGQKMILGLDEWAVYDTKQIRRVSLPTAYAVNPYYPSKQKVDFELAK